MNIIIRDDGTWCRHYTGEEDPPGDLVEVPDDYVVDNDIDTFVANWIDQNEP